MQPRGNGPQGQRIGGGGLGPHQTIQLNLSRAFLSRHERPPTGPNSTVVVGVGGVLGSLLQAAPVSCIVAASGLLRAGILANFGQHGIIGLLLSSSSGGGSLSNTLSTLVGLVTEALPPPFSLLSFTPTRPLAGGALPTTGSRRGAVSATFVHESQDVTADTVTVICITLLMWWFGRPAERRWGPGRFLTYLLVGYVASLVAFTIVYSVGLSGNLTLGASLWMAPSVALLLNSLMLGSSSSTSTAQSLLSNIFTLRGVAGVSLLSYALLLNVSGGLLGTNASAASSASAAFRTSGRSAAYGTSQSSASGAVSVASAAVALAPFVIAGLLQFFFATPYESHIVVSENEAAKADHQNATTRSALHPTAPQAQRNSTKSSGLVARVRSASQRFLYAFLCPRVIQPLLFRFVYASTTRASPAGTTASADQNEKASHRSYRCFQRRVITRLDEIGYTRAGTLMSDEEELFYAAQLQGMVPSGADLNNRARERDRNAVNDPIAAPASPTRPTAAAPNAPLTAEQQDKVDTLLAIGLPNVTAESIRHALISVNWDMDTAMTLLMEQ